MPFVGGGGTESDRTRSGGAAATGARRRDHDRGPGLVSKENARQGSDYYGKVDLAKVAALGQSCGGGQVWEASKDSRIKAIAAINSNFPTRASRLWPGANAPADGWTVEKLAVPAAYFIGGPGDSAYAPSQGSFAATPATAQR